LERRRRLRLTPYSTRITNQRLSKQQSAIPRYGNAIVIGPSLANSDAETGARFAYSQPRDYLVRMHRAFEFCLPTAAKAVPSGPDWIHEIKYDGYRLRVERNGKTVRLFTRNGHDWTKRFPWIVEAH
jgi:ATP-dependent DNA ligase